MVMIILMVVTIVDPDDHCHDYTHGDHYCRSRDSRNVPTTSISGTTGGTQVGMDHEKGQFRFVKFESTISLFLSLSFCGNPVEYF